MGVCLWGSASRGSAYGSASRGVYLRSPHLGGLSWGSVYGGLHLGVCLGVCIQGKLRRSPRVCINRDWADPHWVCIWACWADPPGLHPGWLGTRKLGKLVVCILLECFLVLKYFCLDLFQLFWCWFVCDEVPHCTQWCSNGVFLKCNGNSVNSMYSVNLTKSMILEKGSVEDHVSTCDLLVEWLFILIVK